MNRIRQTLAVVALTLPCGGCGTVINLASRDGPDIYGGVMIDATLIKIAAENPPASIDDADLIGLWDLPFR